MFGGGGNIGYLTTKLGGYNGKDPKNQQAKYGGVLVAVRKNPNSENTKLDTKLEEFQLVDYQLADLN